MFIAERFLISAKKETTYNTDAVPSLSSNAILAFDGSIEYVGEYKDRKASFNYFGGIEGVGLSKLCKIGFKVEVKGSGTGNVAPRIGALLQACGYDETINVSDVTYTGTKTSLTQPSCTIYFYKDLLLHKVTGCRGTFKITGQAGNIPMFEFDMMGFLSSVSQESSLGTPTFESTNPNIMQNATFSIGTISMKGLSFSIDAGNKVVERKDFTASRGISAVLITGCEPKATFDIEADDLATYNPHSAFDNSTTYSDSSLVIGSATGNKITIVINKMQLSEEPKFVNHDGVLGYSLNMKLLSVSDSFISIKFE